MEKKDTSALKAEIRRMCREKNAVVLAHYYTVGEVQEVADFVGDSLALARKAAQTDADIIVMCGVHFMAETCKLLSPDKLVLAPDLEAGCSLADSATPTTCAGGRRSTLATSWCSMSTPPPPPRH